MYYGKHNRYFNVRILQKNGSLFRSDSYEMLPKIMPGGFELDSLRRISRYGPTKLMYPNGQVRVSCEYRDDLLEGPFMVFYEDGLVKRREYYRQGRVRQSACYGPDGSKQTCEPFYQVPKFLGKVADLNCYLEQQVGSLVDGERIRTITALLSINEIGQVVRVEATVSADSSAGTLRTNAVVRMKLAIQNMPEWEPNRLNWKPALSDGRGVPSVCALRVYRYRGQFGSRMNFEM